MKKLFRILFFCKLQSIHKNRRYEKSHKGVFGAWTCLDCGEKSIELEWPEPPPEHKREINFSI